MTAAEAPRRRPRDRKRQVEEAAALAFAEHGYHAVGMQDIAAAVGISAPALYRHFPNKYALFARTAATLAHRLVEATDEASALSLTTAEEAHVALGALLDAITDTTIELRATAGIYRWEGRYLEPGDRELLAAEFAQLQGRLEEAHAVWRPGVATADRSVLVSASLSVVMSITAHHTAGVPRVLRPLVKDAAWRVLDADLSPLEDNHAHAVRELAAAAPDRSAVEAGSVGRAGSPRRRRLLEAAIDQFARKGYHEVTIEEIAAAVELTPSGVYRHFAGKADLLLAACERATAELGRAMQRSREGSDSPTRALRRLTEEYVAHSFRHLALMRVYFADLGNLPPDDRRRLLGLRRTLIADWVALLQGVRPELATREATVLVHAVLAVVSDQAPLLRERGAGAVACMNVLVNAVLGV